MFKIKKKTIYPAQIIKREPPISLVDSKNTNFFRNVKLEFNSINLLQFMNVNITPEGIIFNKLSINKEFLIYPKHKKKYNLVYLISTLVKRKKIKLDERENYLLIFDYWSNSIFHWMCDALPRLEAAKDIAKDCIILIPKSFEYSYIHETLKAFQFKGIELLNDNCYYHCPHLYSVPQLASSGRIRPNITLELRTTLLTHFIPQFSGKLFFNNIYISRNKAKYRKVLNEVEIQPILDKYNFKTIYFEDYSVSEQIEICYNAHNIVSIHGANLTNVIFLKPNSNVLELRKNGDMDNNYFYELTDSINCNYYYLDCEFEDPKPNYNFFNLFVNYDLFETILKQIIYGEKN